jgi:glycogenin glucosyltransferase
VIPVQQIVNNQPANLYVMNRPDLISTFTKIELWRQTQFKRIIYLDADMVVLRAPNELLDLDTDFAAVPDIGWPDCFNSGFMVLNPNMGDYYSLSALAQRGISFDGADQGLLNMHFREWKRLSFVYNCTPSGNYQYVPAYRHFSSSISGVHFIGRDKPWTLGRDHSLSTGVYGELLGMWWSVYDKHYRSQTVTHYNVQNYASRKKVQDYVRGEEPLYVASYPAEQRQSSPSQGQIPLPSSITITDSSSAQSPVSRTVELPMGDAATPVAPRDFQPVPTVQQRKFSAPQIEWEPTR